MCITLCMNNPNDDDLIVQISKNKFNIDYLYPYQRLVISNILEASGYYGKEIQKEVCNKNIVILPTGSGKSICFLLPSILIDGITIIIAPLLSLISDMNNKIQKFNIPFCLLTENKKKKERSQELEKLENSNIKIIISTPETLLSKNILNYLKNKNIKHIAIDEAHTIHNWGKSFRPKLLEIRKIIKNFDNPIVSAFTATASESVISEISNIIFNSTKVNKIVSNPDRSNINYTVIPVLSKNQTLISLLDNSKNPWQNFIGKIQKPVIIFCRSRTSTEMTSLYLKQNIKNIDIYYYHAGLSKQEKKIVENWFYNTKNGILVATCAFGMGIDIKSIRCIIHREVPRSIEAFLQETGRAGRDGKKSRSIVLISKEDKYYLRTLKNVEKRNQYSNLLNIFYNYKNCRRKQLMLLLDFKIDFCTGCDVCNKKIIQKPIYSDFFKIINKRLLKYYPILVVYNLLKGNYTPFIIENFLYNSKFFGTLYNWNCEEIKNQLKPLKNRKFKSIIKGYFKKYILNLFK